MRTILSTASAIVLAGCISAGAQTLDDVAADTYELERTHAFLNWTVSHFGLSDYTVNFTDFDATLEFNPEEPTASKISVTINPLALQTNYPEGERKAEWETELATDDKWLNGDEFPKITFVSTAAEATGEFTGTVTGDLTFLGVTKPVTLDVTYNGTANYPWNGGRDSIGFSAATTLKRSDFGNTAFAPNISDEVKIKFTGEFLQPES